MQNSLFPSNIIEHSAERILSRYSAKGHAIYCTLVLLVIFIFILLPIIKVDVSVQSKGIIRPITEKNEIRLIINGTVSDIFVKENQKLEKGQRILALNSSVTDEKLKYIQYDIKEKTNSIRDLKLLTSGNGGRIKKIKTLKTQHYRNEYTFYKNKIKENQHKLNKANKESERHKYLHKEKVISLSELEYKQLEVSRLAINRKMLTEQQFEKWNKDLLSNRLKLKELNLQKEQIGKEREYCTVKSPLKGTLEQFSGISIGSYLQKGQLIAVISPQKELIAEVHVSPRDIGLIKDGAKVKIQVDAFNYNQWGLLTGKIIEISNDFLVMNKQPVFRVRCGLDQTYLQLKSGYRGNLKKGMTIRARILITRRSLFQLLYDNVDNWLNPMQRN